MQKNKILITHIITFNINHPWIIISPVDSLAWRIVLFFSIGVRRISLNVKAQWGSSQDFEKKKLLFSCLMGLLICRLIDSHLFLIPWMISESVFLDFDHRPRTIANQKTSMVLTSAEDFWSTHLCKGNNNQTVLFSVSPVWDSIYFSVIDNYC